MSVDGPKEKEQMSVDEDTQKWDKTTSVKDVFKSLF